MKAIFTLGMSLTVVLLTACAGGSDSADSGDGPRGQVNGKPAAEYYAQFLSDDPQTLCKSPQDEITVSSVSTSSRGSLVSLYLFKSGKARLIVEGQGAGVWNMTWRLSGLDLVVGRDFVLTGLTHNGRETLRMQSAREAVDVPAVLKGQFYVVFEKDKDYWNCSQLPN